MRVLLLGSYPPPYGGLQVHIVALRRFLLERSISCAVINMDRHREESKDQVFYPKSAVEVIWLLLRLRFDVAHLHVGGDLTTRHLMLGLLCSWLPGSKAVLTLHSGGYPSSAAGRSITARSFRGFVMRQFDQLIGVNEEIVALFRRAGVPASRAHLIEPHAAFRDDLEELSRAEKSAVMGKSMAEFFDAHDPILLTVGLLEEEYNLGMQIEALATLLETRERAGLVIIGSGSREAELCALIAEKRYRDRVLLCGDVEHAATLRAIAECDLLLRPTSYDGDAISVREALHFGTPVLASDNGMRPEGVRLLDRLDPTALAAAIEAALDSPERPRETKIDATNLVRVVDVYHEAVSR